LCRASAGGFYAVRVSPVCRVGIFLSQWKNIAPSVNKNITPLRPVLVQRLNSLSRAEPGDRLDFGYRVNPQVVLFS